MTEEEALQKLEFERKWLSDAGYNTYNVDVAFVSIRNIIKVLCEVPAIPIPANATNGDMIKAMFPNAKIVRGLYGISGTPLMCLNLGTGYDVHEMSFVEDWWNAPYRAESEG